MNGVSFDEKHSIRDWDLLMTSKTIGEPTAVTSYVQIPGRDGSIDLTEALGEVRYTNRQLIFQFDIFQNAEEWWKLKQTISSYLHGRKRKIILDVDPNYYYEGRCSVTSFYHETTVGHITVECECLPYKMMTAETVISKNVTATDTIILNNQRKTVMPTVKATGDIVFKFEDKQFSISSTTTLQSPDFMLKEGNNIVTIVSGSGSITFTYREGTL